MILQCSFSLDLVSLWTNRWSLVCLLVSFWFKFNFYTNQKNADNWDVEIGKMRLVSKHMFYIKYSRLNFCPSSTRDDIQALWTFSHVCNQCNSQCFGQGWAFIRGQLLFKICPCLITYWRYPVFIYLFFLFSIFLFIYFFTNKFCQR